MRSAPSREILNPAEAYGVPITTLPELNRLLKGHRRGELTVLTGPTGAGKTSLLSALSLDLCKQGVCVCREVGEEGVMAHMLPEVSGGCVHVCLCV